MIEEEGETSLLCCDESHLINWQIWRSHSVEHQKHQKFSHIVFLSNKYATRAFKTVHGHGSHVYKSMHAHIQQIHKSTNPTNLHFRRIHEIINPQIHQALLWRKPVYLIASRIQISTNSTLPNIESKSKESLRICRRKWSLLVVLTLWGLSEWAI